MLTKVLKREDCASCQICCSFDSYDIWETPIIDNELKSEIVKISPSQKFITRGESWLLRLDKEQDEDLFYCSMLDRQTGCRLGDKKPFDCRIWPFRIMELDGTQVVTLSPVCPVMLKKPLNELRELAQELAPQIFAEADKNPDIVKKYISQYPILAVRET